MKTAKTLCKSSRRLVWWNVIRLWKSVLLFLLQRRRDRNYWMPLVCWAVACLWHDASVKWDVYVEQLPGSDVMMNQWNKTSLLSSCLSPSHHTYLLELLLATHSGNQIPPPSQSFSLSPQEVLPYWACVVIFILGGHATTEEKLTRHWILQFIPLYLYSESYFLSFW